MFYAHQLVKERRRFTPLDRPGVLIDAFTSNTVAVRGGSPSFQKILGDYWSRAV
jgi:hypothetical protein